MTELHPMPAYHIRFELCLEKKVKKKVRKDMFIWEGKTVGYSTENIPDLENQKNKNKNKKKSWIWNGDTCLLWIDQSNHKAWERMRLSDEEWIILWCRGCCVRLLALWSLPVLPRGWLVRLRSSVWWGCMGGGLQGRRGWDEWRTLCFVGFVWMGAGIGRRAFATMSGMCVRRLDAYRDAEPRISHHLLVLYVFVFS